MLKRRRHCQPLQDTIARRALTAWLWCANSAAISAIGLRTLDLSCLHTGGGSHGIEFATDHVRSIGVWAQVPGGGAVEISIT